MRSSSVKEAFKQLRASEGNDCCEVCRWRPPRALRDVAGGRIDALLHSHHIVPVACGGEDAASNLILVCPTCHSIAHHIGKIRHDRGGGLSAWLGPRSRRELLFWFGLMKNREEYPRLAKMGYDAYMAAAHDEALEEDAVHNIRIHRLFAVSEGGQPRKHYKGLREDVA